MTHPFDVPQATFLSRVREILTEAIRFWEPLRIMYNLALAMIVAAYFVAGWPASKNTVTLDSILLLFVLAVVANLCYCAAYVGDVFVQLSGCREAWRSVRWVVFVVGLAFAGVITRYFALAFFGS